MQLKYLIPLVILVAGCAPTPVEKTAPPPRVTQHRPLQVANEQVQLLAAMQQLAPSADPQVLSMALQARQCAVSKNRVSPGASKLAVIDYSRPSSQKRLWVFDLAQRRLLFDEYVAHGEGSGDNMAHAFSNTDNSHQSSLGLFTTAETYYGANGYSMRMDGLEPGVNDNARPRAIVMHGADYVNPLLINTQGRIGRSWGCPAVARNVSQQMIDTLKNGNLVFAFYPDQNWIRNSNYLDCGGAAIADLGGFNSRVVGVDTDSHTTHGTP